MLSNIIVDAKSSSSLERADVDDNGTGYRIQDTVYFIISHGTANIML